eukprot:3428770-Prymnesium_polylepis.1
MAAGSNCPNQSKPQEKTGWLDLFSEARLLDTVAARAPGSRGSIEVAGCQVRASPARRESREGVATPLSALRCNCKPRYRILLRPGPLAGPGVLRGR